MRRLEVGKKGGWGVGGWRGSGNNSAPDKYARQMSTRYLYTRDWRGEGVRSQFTMSPAGFVQVFTPAL